MAAVAVDLPEQMKTIYGMMTAILDGINCKKPQDFSEAQPL